MSSKRPKGPTRHDKIVASISFALFIASVIIGSNAADVRVRGGCALLAVFCLLFTMGKVFEHYEETKDDDQ